MRNRQTYRKPAEHSESTYNLFPHSREATCKAYADLLRLTFLLKKIMVDICCILTGTPRDPWRKQEIKTETTKTFLLSALDYHDFHTRTN